MQHIQLIDFPENYSFLWQRLQAAITKKRVPHGIIFCGNVFSVMQTMALKLAATLNCSSINKPCMQCRDCNLILKYNHPNICIVNSGDTSIKIDDVRLLKDFVFKSIDEDKYKIIIIEHADSMTNSAMNGLLKLIEEPTSNTVFILLLRNIKKLPLTILSRCHQYYFEDFDDETNTSLYKDLCIKFESFLSDCISPVVFAEELKEYAIEDILNFLYQYSIYQIKQSLQVSEFAHSKNILDIKETEKLFSILDNISDCKKKIHLGLNLNERLVLEQILIQYL